MGGSVSTGYSMRRPVVPIIRIESCGMDACTHPKASAAANLQVNDVLTQSLLMPVTTRGTYKDWGYVVFPLPLCVCNSKSLGACSSKSYPSSTERDPAMTTS
jgi:hypothetical protein